ncbi:MAG: MBL fold metallo-hydrolase [Methylophilaceae bacterium]|jgi:phosphoribosyl 1,2-cyclic phosphodiesterase
MFLFASLGSGSEGNSFLIKTDKTIFMVDCGFNYKETENRLSELGLTFSDINHILITHEHEDHMRAIKMIIKKEKIQISCSYGTAKKIGIVDEVNIINPGDIVVDNDLQVEVVPVPHDAREPCHYVFKKDTLKIGIITDFGSLTPKIIESYSNLNYLVVEANHDANLLMKSSYPTSLKNRIFGKLGHANNDLTFDLISQIKKDKLKKIIFCHLSKQNNQKEIIKHTVKEYFDKFQCEFISQENIFNWSEIK